MVSSSHAQFNPFGGPDENQVEFGIYDSGDDFYDSDREETRDFFLVERGPVSTVRKGLKTGFGDDPSVPQWVAVKTATTNRKFSKQPHDVLKEVRLLSGLSHVNVVTLLDYTDDQPSWEIRLWMPFIPLSLDQILDSPSFSPFPFPSLPIPIPIRSLPTKPNDHLPPSSLTSRFLILSRSLAFQILSAIAYLHDPSRNIAHRDIKPRNLLITEEGCVKLIDFGISWKSDETEQDKKGDLWPEGPGEMCTAISTGPYRAPELLFGPKSYNAFSTDSWSLGTTLSEFFTSLHLIPSPCDDDHDEFGGDESEEDLAHVPFILPSSNRENTLDPDTDYKWHRTSLFNGRRGELGLVWSVFKTMGTPDEASWPGFKDLASARSVMFSQVLGVPLESRLPNLPPSDTASALDLVSKLLIYPPEERLKPKDALSHSWLASSDISLLLPPGYPLHEQRPNLISEWDGYTLGHLVKQVLDFDRRDKNE